MKKLDWIEIILSALDGAILLTVFYIYLMKKGIEIDPFDLLIILIVTAVAMFFIRVTVKLFQNRDTKKTNKYKVGDLVAIRGQSYKPYSIINVPEDVRELYTLRPFWDWDERGKLRIVHEKKLKKFQMKIEYIK